MFVKYFCLHTAVAPLRNTTEKGIQGDESKTLKMKGGKYKHGFYKQFLFRIFSLNLAFKYINTVSDMLVVIEILCADEL